jgi:hypothetical protein
MTLSPLRVVLVIALLQVTTACAVGTTHLRVDHSPFEGGASAKTGDLLVRTFRDLREEDRRPYIGAKRNGFGMVLGHVAVPEGQSLEGILSQFFVEALQRAGYRAVLAETETSMPADFHPIGMIDGDIETFWLDMYMATWHSIVIDIRLSDLSDTVLWEGRVEGDESNVLWVGVNAEFEKVIRQALDEALDQAATDFGSAAFQEQVRIAADLDRARAHSEEVAPTH